MAGIKLPSLHEGTGTKAQHNSKAKNPHPSSHFAELFKAKSQEPTEARKNNQPARTAQAEGPKQESGKRKAAVESLVVEAPFCVTPQTPSPQVSGGGRSDAVAAAVKSGVHPKTSSRVLELSKSGDIAGQIMAERNAAVNNTRLSVREGEGSAMQKLHQRGQSREESRVGNTAPTTATPITPQATVGQAQGAQLGIQITPTKNTSPVGQVAGLIINAAANGSPQAELILYPENLGSVQVQLQVDPTGAIQATVVADQAAAQVLAADLDQLRQSLEAAGLQIADLQMQTRDASQSGGEFSGQSQSGGTRSDIQISNSPEAQPLTTQSLHALIQGGAQLDLQI